MGVTLHDHEMDQERATSEVSSFMGVRRALRSSESVVQANRSTIGVSQTGFVAYGLIARWLARR